YSSCSNIYQHLNNIYFVLFVISILLSYFLIIFFLMIRRPPRSTLFPYNDALPISSSWSTRRVWSCTCCAGSRSARSPGCSPGSRSEEHTSELQSRGHLVCRLLLEKKKKKCN